MLFLPARVRFTNLAWQHNRDRELLERAAADPTVDVIIGVEARERDGTPVDVATILGPGWVVHQVLDGDDAADRSARCQTFVAVRRSSLPAGAEIVRHDLVLIAAGQGRTAHRTGLQDRYLLDLEIRVPEQPPLHLIAVHIPLGSTGKHLSALLAVRRYLAELRRRGHLFVVGSDVNRRVAAAAAFWWTAWRGIGRWGLFYSWRLVAGPRSVDDSVTKGGLEHRLTDTPFVDATVSAGRTPATPRRPLAERPGRGPGRPAKPSKPRRRRRRRPGAQRPRRRPVVRRPRKNRRPHRPTR